MWTSGKEICQGIRKGGRLARTAIRCAIVAHLLTEIERKITMPKLTIDATEAKSFEPLPDDQYECTILEVGEVKSGPKARYVPITFEVSDGDYASRRLWRNFVIEGPGAGFFTDLWHKATGEELELGEMNDVDTDDLIGKSVICITKQEEYEGNVRSQVDKILAVA